MSLVHGGSGVTGTIWLRMQFLDCDDVMVLRTSSKKVLCERLDTDERDWVRER